MSLVRLLLVAVLMVFGAQQIQAAVYAGLPTLATQPDGTRIPIKVYGDEFHAVMEHQGYSVVVDPATRFLCYARLTDGHLQSTGVAAGSLDPRTLGLPARLRPAPAVAQEISRQRRQRLGIEKGYGHALRAQAAARLAGQDSATLKSPPSHQTVGSVVGLALLVDFSDDVGMQSQLSEIDAYFNSLSYNGYGNSGSIRQYYSDVSKQKLDFTNVVGSKAFIRMPKPKAWYNYVDGDQAKGYRSDGEAGPMLVKDAFAVLDSLTDEQRQAQYGIDFSTLSTRTGGIVTAVSVLYAGERPGTWAEGLWPHMMPAEARAIDIPLSGSGVGKTIRTYQISDLSTSLTIGTVAHECGHMVCDFPDLYDYASVTNGVGAYCLMDIGSYGNDGRTPIRVSGYLRYMAGWYDAGDVVDLGAVGPAAWGRRAIDVNGIYLYPNGGKMGTGTREFFLIEHRVRTGWDATIPDEGMAIWHIDTLSSNSLNDPAYKDHNEAQLVQADGRDDLGDAVNYGDDTDFFPNGSVTSFNGSSTPAAMWWTGRDSGLLISEISNPQALMTFRIGTPEPYFLKHPTNGYGRAGKTVLFSVQVVSDPAASFQWQRQDKGGTQWTAIIGATGDHYGFTISDSDIGAGFRCVATNALGATTSTSATIVYEPLPSENVAVPSAPGASGHAVPPPVYAVPGGGGESSGCGLGSGLGALLAAVALAVAWLLRRPGDRPL